MGLKTFAKFFLLLQSPLHVCGYCTVGPHPRGQPAWDLNNDLIVRNFHYLEVISIRITIYKLYVLQFSCGSTFMLFANWKPSVEVCTCENLDQGLVQWQNMAIHEL